MQKQLLDQKHPSYELDRWAQYRALYHSGPQFKARLKTFLPQNAQEPAKIYQKRCEVACYRSIVNVILNQSVAQLFAAPFTIRSNPPEVPEFYARLKEDSDRSGTDLSDLISRLVLEALMVGRSWIRADLPEGQEQRTHLSLSEFQARQLGDAWLTPLSAEDVLDWEMGSDGKLDWVMIHSCQAKRASLAQSRGSLVEERWTYYDRNEFQQFALTYDPNKPLSPETEVPLVASGSHGFPEVPFRCFDLSDGLWSMARMAEAQIEHFRMENRLSWVLNRTAFSIPIFFLEDADHPPSHFEAGYGIVMSKDEKFEWSSPPADSFEVMQNAIAAQEKELYRLGLQPQLYTEFGSKSAESKQADTRATEIWLHTLGSRVKEFIQSILSLVSAGRGDELAWSIEGMDSFQVRSASDAVQVAQAVLMLGIPSPLFKKELYKNVASVCLPNGLSQEIKDQINQEITDAEVEITPLQSPGFAPPANPGGDAQPVAKQLPLPVN